MQRVYNGLGQLIGEYQSHSGVVVQGVTPEVQYNYNEMSNGENNSRLVSIIYPNNVEVDYTYNTGLDDSISRLSGLSSSGATLVSFKYLGLNTVVEMDNPATNINLTYIQQTGDPYANTDGGDQYTGLDRFGRIIDQFWINASNGTTVDRYQYGYNPDGDVLYRQNLVVAAMSEVYSYDNLNQLTSFARGTLNATKTGIQGTPSRTQSYTPDALGNFSSVNTNGTAQTRTANQQNEITSISGQSSPTYDANGNMTADGTGNTYVYDAWNRLVTIKNNGTTVASYIYDGLDRLIQTTDTGTTTDLYVSAADQVLTEYQGGAATAYNVWNPEYVNALLFHNQGNGYQYQRWYVLQDANWNVTALVDASQNVLERYAYDPYGAVTVMSASWVVLSHSYYNVPNGYQGMRYDWTTAVNITWARVYDPALMRWTQADPLGLGPDNNDYRMEGNGPTGAVDPLGLAPPGLRVIPVAPTISNVLQWTQDMMSGRRLTPPMLVRPIVDIPERVTTVYDVSRAGGQSKAESVALAGLIVVSDTVGVTNLDEAGRGKELITNRELGTGERWVRGTIGATQLGTTGYLLYKYPTPAQVRQAKAAICARYAPAGRWQTVNEAMSARARAYQTQVTGRTGEAYVVNGVRFDGVNGATLLEAKGPGYANFVRHGRFQRFFKGQDALLDQARRQVAAANGASITWHVAEADAATAMRNLLASDPRTAVINVVYTPLVP